MLTRTRPTRIVEVPDPTPEQIQDRLDRLERNIQITADGYISYRLPEGFRVEVNMLERDSVGCQVIAYRFFDRSLLIFHGSYRPSPSYGCATGVQATLQLLYFFLVQPGDTDADYFAVYTKRQYSWLKRRANTLACVLRDFQLDE